MSSLIPEEVGTSDRVAPSHHFDKKQDAVETAREISRNQGTELKIHNKDGWIGQSDSHGNDVNPPEG